MTEEQPPATKPTGLTNDAGWQIGVQRTLPLELEDAWSFLVSTEGTRIWLGTKTPPDPVPGAPYKTLDGTVGEIRSFRVYDRVRLTWKPKQWDHDSTVQVALTPGTNGTAFRFHQERLMNQQEREQMRAHWTAALDRLEAELDRRG